MYVLQPLNLPALTCSSYYRRGDGDFLEVA